MATLKEDSLSEDYFEAGFLILIFCCYGYGENASEAVEKIATDKNNYQKCFFCVIVCYITTAY